MLDAAWNAATSLVDSKADLCDDLAEAETRFLKRKSCQGLAEEDCRAAFQTSVEIVRTVLLFRRANCGSLPPKPTRRYELLLSLAKELESKFPNSDTALTMAGCRMAELYWDR